MLRRSIVAASAAGALGAVAVPQLDQSAAAAPPVRLDLSTDPAAQVARDASAAAHERLVRRTLRVARRVAKLEGDRLSAAYVKRLREKSARSLVRKRARLTRELRQLRRYGGAPKVAIPAALASIAACESGGDPRAIGGGGAYRGKYQFDYGTWASVGGTGDPAAAPEGEQDRRAAMLYARAGASPWPVCGS